MSTEMISLRMPVGYREMIDAAAELCGKSRTAFIVASAVDRAREALLDRTEFWLPPDKWEAFMSALDAPVSDTAMRKTMSMPTPWEK